MPDFNLDIFTNVFSFSDTFWACLPLNFPTGGKLNIYSIGVSKIQISLPVTKPMKKFFIYKSFKLLNQKL
jgi:hypothetical protein